MSDTLKTVTDAYTEDSARIRLSRCEALILTHLLNRGPLRIAILRKACERSYAVAGISVALSRMRKRGLVEPVGYGRWRAL